MLIIRRKNLVIGLLVVLLIITGYLNFVYNQSAPTANPDDETDPLTDNEINSETAPLTDTETVDGEISISDLNESDSLPNINNGDNENIDTVTTSSSSFFRDYRFEREQDRGKEIAYINTIVANEISDAEIIKEAQAQLLEITSNMEAELVIENLIKAKGFTDVVVIMHKNSVNVIVDKPELLPEEVARILEVVKRQSEASIENIKIIPKI